MLIAESGVIHHVAQTFDDAEGIDTDPGVREVLPEDKAVAHIAAEVFHPFPLRQ